MKERPILFSAPMVRAILDGQKTMTRRVVTLRHGADVVVTNGQVWKPVGFFDYVGYVECPYGKVSDRLWVRESWRIGAWREDDGRLAIDYLASGPAKTPWITVPEDAEDYHGGNAFEKYWIQSTDDAIRAGHIADAAGKFRWEPGQSPCRKRPSIHMPRWASRITLEVTGVRVERLQMISRGDAMAEGCPFQNMAPGPDPCEWYADLWDSINGNRPKLPTNTASKRYARIKRWLDKHPDKSWDANPWVWCISFRRIEP